jgi:hypothetical protein
MVVEQPGPVHGPDVVAVPHRHVPRDGLRGGQHGVAESQSFVLPRVGQLR